MPAKRVTYEKKKKAHKHSLKPKRRYAGGYGAYYVQGGAYASSKIPGVGKFGGALNAGLYHGELAQKVPVISGLGAYNVSQIKHNVLIKPDIPIVRNSMVAEGATIVRHREYLGPIISSATALGFTKQLYPLNPAQEKTFPWLSTIARNYEEYRPNGLLFEFRSTSSDAIASSTNLALGQVMLCTQYDPTDDPFKTDVELLNYTWAQSGKVSDNLMHYVECDPKQSPLAHLYTREGATTQSSDLRFSDFGRFTIAVSGLQGTNVQIGQLWVTYEFLLYKPKLSAGIAVEGGWFHFSNEVGLTDTNPFGSNPEADGEFDRENNLGITVLDSNNDGAILFPVSYKPRTFMIVMAQSGTSAGSVTAPNFGITTDPLIHFVEHFNQNSTTQIQMPLSAGASSQNSTITWISIDPSPDEQTWATLKVRSNSPPASVLRVDLYICEIPYLDPRYY